MELPKNYLARFEKPARVFTKDQALADEIWRYFGKSLPFGRIARMIKEKGNKAIYEIFNNIRKGECRDPLSLFIFQVKNEKIQWLTDDEKAGPHTT